jgi:hypothetical protein
LDSIGSTCAFGFSQSNVRKMKATFDPYQKQNSMLRQDVFKIALLLETPAS